MNFTEFKKAFQKNFADMTKDADVLFEVNVDKDLFWNLYLDSFPAGTNEIFRERREAQPHQGYHRSQGRPVSAEYVC